MKKATEIKTKKKSNLLEKGEIKKTILARFREYLTNLKFILELSMPELWQYSHPSYFEWVKYVSAAFFQAF